VRYKRDVALMCRYLGTAAEERNDLQTAQPFIDRAIGIDRARVQAAPLDRIARLDLSFDLSVEGTIYKVSHDLPAAVRTFEEVLKMREELVRLDAHDEQAKDRLFFALCELGLLHGLLHEYPASAAYYRSAVSLGEALARTNSRPNEQFAERLQSATEGLAVATRQQQLVKEAITR